MELQMASANKYVHKSQNLNFSNAGFAITSTVWLFDANNNFKITIGPSMNHERDIFGCGIYHSSFHSGRPVIVASGSSKGKGRTSSEIWDFTLPGSQWQLSKNKLLNSEKSLKTLSLKGCRALNDKPHNFVTA